MVAALQEVPTTAAYLKLKGFAANFAMHVRDPASQNTALGSGFGAEHLIQPVLRQKKRGHNGHDTGMPPRWLMKR